MATYHKASKRFSLLLLEDGEDYVQHFVASCQWPADVEGNWSRAQAVEGRLRLCSKSLAFDADDAAIPIVR